MTSAPPEVWCVLTTRSTDPDPASFYESRRQLHRAIRRRWPRAEYAALVEFTTGYGARSGGSRRPHWNLLIKNVPACDLDALRAVITGVWCGREDARPDAQHVGLVSEAGGLMRYIAMHFQKSSQSPPAGWRGHRFMHSRGYFPEGIQAVRERAREQLRSRRALWQAEQLMGPNAWPEDVEHLAEAYRTRAALQTWELVRVHDAGTDPRRRELERARRPFAKPRGDGNPDRSAAPVRAIPRESTAGAGAPLRAAPDERTPARGRTASAQDGRRGASALRRPPSALPARPTPDARAPLHDPGAERAGPLQSAPIRPPELAP